MVTSYVSAYVCRLYVSVRVGLTGAEMKLLAMMRRLPKVRRRLHTAPLMTALVKKVAKAGMDDDTVTNRVTIACMLRDD